MFGRQKTYAPGILYFAPADYRTPNASNVRTGGIGEFYIDLELVIPPWTKINSLYLWEWNTLISGCVFGIMRRDATNTFTCAKRLVVTTTATNTWQQYSLPAEFVVPNDGCRYFLGLADSAANVCLPGTRSIARRPSAPAEGQQHADYVVATITGVPMGFHGSKPVYFT